MVARPVVLNRLHRFDEAVAACDKVLAFNSDDAATWYARAWALGGLHRYDEAAEDYDRSLALDPAHARVWANKGWNQRELGRVEDALTCFERAVELAPEDADAATGRARTLYQLERNEEALAAYERAVELAPEDVSAATGHANALYRLKHNEEALAAYTRALELDPQAPAMWHYKGMSCHRLGRDEEALAAYERALALDEHMSETWPEQARSYFALAQYTQALVSAERAQALDDSSVDAWNLQAAALAHLGRDEEALAAYDRALALAPASATIWGNKAMSLRTLGRFEDPLVCDKRLIELATGDDDLRHRRQYGYDLNSLARYEDSLAAFEDILQRMRDDAHAWSSKGYALYHLGCYDEAMGAYDEAVRLRPDDTAVRAVRAAVQRAVQRTTTDQRMRLRDGRWLGYLDYGHPEGLPILCGHGTPSSRLNYFGDEDLLRELRIRLIIPDRPGYGLSDFQRRRRLLDWPGDVQQLANHLGLARFAVLGVSGGGPHAAACAALLGQRLTRVGLVSSPCPPDLAPRIAELPPRDRVATAIQRFCPWPLQRVLGVPLVWLNRAHPEFMLAILHNFNTAFQPDGQSQRTTPSDVWPHGLPPALREEVIEPYRQGVRGHAWDSRLCHRSWGFRLTDLAGREMHLWHGERDQLAPIAMGRALAEAIPGCRATFYANEGHNVFGVHCREILSTLAAMNA